MSLSQERARAQGSDRRVIRAFQISTGLGAGNLGDDLMARAFWNQLGDDIQLEVPLYPEASRLHEPYPPRHHYLEVDAHGNENGDTDLPGLLVGDTPVTEVESVQFPMGFLAPRLLHFHRRGLSVDAIGVGVDQIHSAEAKQLFRDAYLPIRSWTVRCKGCKDALLSLGVPESRVRVGADLAWLYEPRQNLREWAGDFWRGVGIDPSQPLLVVNVVNLIWSDEREARANIAAALDLASEQFSLQVAFFCNECRAGAEFDFQAAQETAALMKRPALIVPNEYFSADEALALLECATVTVGQRYHFILETVLARSVPVSIVRGQKMMGLSAELGIPVGGTVAGVEREVLVEAIQGALEHRQAFLITLDRSRRDLFTRAESNFSFMREMEPFRSSVGFGAAAAGRPPAPTTNKSAPRTELKTDPGELEASRVSHRDVVSRESSMQKELDEIRQELASAQKLNEEIGRKTAEVQALRARVELERYRMRLQLDDQEKRLTSKDTELDSLRAAVHGLVEQLKVSREECAALQNQLDASLAHRAALEVQIETSLALRAARSLRWVLQPIRKLVPKAPANGNRA